jgi:hypothetical protein
VIDLATLSDIGEMTKLILGIKVLLAAELEVLVSLRRVVEHLKSRGHTTRVNNATAWPWH